MSSTNVQSMNHIEASSPYSNSGSIRSYDSNCSMSYPVSLSSSGQVYTNAAYEHSDSSGVSSSPSHDYEDLTSIRTEVKGISGPRKKTNDLYEPGPRKKTNDVYQPTRRQRVRQITECSDISIASFTPSDAFPIKKETCQSKVILCLILAVSVAALVLVVLIISGKLGPKCGCAQENNLPAPSTGSSVSFQSLLSRIKDLEKMVELLQAQVSAQERIVNETASKVSVVDGVWVNMTITHEKFEKMLDTGFKLLNTSVKKLDMSHGKLSLTVNELRQYQNLTKRMSERLAVNVTHLESSVQEMKKSNSNMSSRAGCLERGNTHMNTLMKTLQAVNGAQNVSHEHLHSLYKRLNGSLVAVNLTLNDKLKSLFSSGSKAAANFSSCQYMNISDGPVSTGKHPHYGAISYVRYKEPSNKRVMGITCSTDYAQHYKLSYSKETGTYKCDCKGLSPAYKNKRDMYCFIHVWECSLSSS